MNLFLIIKVVSYHLYLEIKDEKILALSICLPSLCLLIICLTFSHNDLKDRLAIQGQVNSINRYGVAI